MPTIAELTAFTTPLDDGSWLAAQEDTTTGKVSVSNLKLLFAPASGTYVTPTTLSNGSLPASVTTLTASDTVAIGVTNPVNKLSIYNTTLGDDIQIENVASNGQASFSLKTNVSSWTFGLGAGSNSLVPNTFFFYNQTTGTYPLVATNSGNVGLSYTTPYRKFQFSSNFGTATGNGMRFGLIGEESNYFLDLTSNAQAPFHLSYRWQTNSIANGLVDVMYWEDTGNVGIRTTSPLNSLDVAGGVNVGTAILGTGSASVDTSILNAISPTIATASTVTTEAAFKIFRNGTAGTKFNPNATINVGSYATGLAAHTQLDFALADGNTNAPDVTVMSLLGSGKVGIGTASPSQPLTVVGGSLLNGIYAGYNDSVSMGNDNNGQMIHFGGTSAIDLILEGYGPHGNVGIGTTNPLGKLSVGDGSINDSNLMVQISTGASGTEANYAVNKNGGYGVLLGFKNSTNQFGTIGPVGYMRQVSNDPIGITMDAYNAGVMTTLWNTSGDVGIGGPITADNMTGATLVAKGTGNVGIGTTNPQARLHVIDANTHFTPNAGGLAFSFDGGDSNNYDNFIANSFSGGSPSPNQVMSFKVNNGTSGTTVTPLILYGTGNSFFGGNVGIGTTAPSALLDVNGPVKIANGVTLSGTVTSPGTTGNQTINKASGTVNIAAAGTSVTVTNSLVTTDSIVTAVIRSNDATARIANIVPSAGSFTINLTAAATAETSIGFVVINP